MRRIPTIALVTETTRFRDLTVADFVHKLASGEPVPGGGSAAAIAASLGGALVAMVASLSEGRPKYAAHAALHAEAIAAGNALADRFLALADEDADAYAGYDSWADGKTDIKRLSCWAHARRKFHEAFKAGQTLAAGALAAIQQLYQVEATLRQHRAEPGKRLRLRQEMAAPVLLILKSDLVALRQRPEVLPRSLLGKAIDYTLTLWDRLNVYLHHGHLEIDSNWIYAALGINPVMPRPRLCRVAA